MSQQDHAEFRIRAAGAADAAGLRDILNAIVAIGGTTAFETPLSLTQFTDHFLTGSDCRACFVAEGPDGDLLGFQWLGRHADLPADWADIATFTRRAPKKPGVGAALFQHTLAFARDAGLAAINATIRADNPSGIPYYEKMGFRTYKVARGVPLKDGTPVDRVSKRYGLDRS